ncbi:PLP-dependent aminotransferase family protein [Rhizobiaceae bacterium BDR2-2]|uniref:PLP-dependent aminotransferase family protein n=1 Tax=Ectorhizobium quercum TaxID=2965071 RepID=A0AAE3SX22_9HYPH|nr:PLP-dependent aminotransferase family protein [Ectorhizobium quercum]MCX8998020.1 PLP-dependent aminotransferase family protein [Ectorhizobium quercum]
MRTNRKTNLPDWSALMPVLPEAGTRAAALYNALRRLIETGLAPPGAKLPPTRDLMKRLKLSRAAAVTAYERLVAEGFAEARVGAGTFVAEAVPLLGDAPPLRPATLPQIEPPAPGLLALGVATPDLRTFDIFRRLIAHELARPHESFFRYGDPRGSAALRQAVADYLQTARGVRCAPEQIVITSGMQQGLDLVLRATLERGDGVLVEDPCYPSALAAVRGAGGRPIAVPVDQEGLDPALIGPAGRSARVIYVTPSHQFPLGVTMTMRRRLALIDWAKANGAIIIEDDYDSEFRYAGPPLAALQGMDDTGSVVYLGTFSKVLFPGLRTGYAVVPERLLPRVLDLRRTSDRQPPVLAEQALARLISEGHFSAHLKRARRTAERARDILVAALKAECGEALLISPPAQGLHLVARFTRFGAREAGSAPALAFETAVAAETGLRPLSPMYLGQPRDQGLVLGFSGFTTHEMKAAAASLGAALGKRQGRHEEARKG